MFFLASLSTLSLPSMFVHALTLWIMTLYLEQFHGCNDVCYISSLFGWLYCEKGCLK